MILESYLIVRSTKILVIFRVFATLIKLGDELRASCFYYIHWGDFPTLCTSAEFVTQMGLSLVELAGPYVIDYVIDCYRTPP